MEKPPRSHLPDISACRLRAPAATRELQRLRWSPRGVLQLRPLHPSPMLHLPPSSPETIAAVELGRQSSEHLSAPQQEQLQCLLRDFVDIFAAR